MDSDESIDELESLMQQFSDGNHTKPVDTGATQTNLQFYRASSNSNETNNQNQIIQFPDLSIILEKIDMNWNDNLLGIDSIYVTNKDTAYFNLLPGEWFDNKKFKVEPSEFDKIELYEKIVCKMAIQSDGSIVKQDVSLCVIYNWKKFESDWNRVQLDSDELSFKSNENNMDAVINFTVEEFKAAVKDHCGIDWYNEIKNIKTKDKLPAELFISSYIFKMVALNSKTGQRIHKYIVFETPTSC